jgi:hypothetical protein
VDAKSVLSGKQLRALRMGRNVLKAGKKSGNRGKQGAERPSAENGGGNKTPLVGATVPAGGVGRGLFSASDMADVVAGAAKEAQRAVAAGAGGSRAKAMMAFIARDVRHDPMADL